MFTTIFFMLLIVLVTVFAVSTIKIVKHNQK